MAKALSALDINMWRERIKISEAWRKPQETKWKRYIGYLKNKFLDTVDSGDVICVNLVHPMVKVIIPAIYSKNPDIVVIPRREEFEEAAELMQTYLRYIFKEIGLKDEVKLCLLDALLIGHAWIKTGYSTTFEQYEAEENQKLSLVQFALKMAGLRKQTKKEIADENMASYAAAPNEKVVDERPWAIRTSPFDIFVPAYSRRPETLPWIAERMVLPIVDVENHPGWDVPSEIRPSQNVYQLLQDRGGNSVTGGETTDTDLNFKIMYEIWDIREGCIYTISDNDDVCYEYKENEYSFLDSRHSYLMLKFNDIPDEFYPQSDVEPWEPQIHELNKTRTQMMNHRKRYNRRYVVTSGSFTPAEIDKLQKGDDGTLVETTADTASESLMPVIDAPLPPEVYKAEESVKRDITEISGITGYQRGDTQAGAKTATEAAIVESQSRNRNEERLDVVNTFANKVAKNIASISQRFMDASLAIPIVGQQAAMSWINIKDKKALKGDFIYDAVYGSSIPINPDVDRQQFNEFYGMTANDPYFDPVKIRLEMVRKYRLPAPETYLNKEIAAQLKQAAINKAMGVVSKEGGGEADMGTAPDSAAPSNVNGGPMEPQVPAPGGVGGGALIKV